MRSVNGGMSFSIPVKVTNIGDSLSRFPTVTTDDMGHPIVAFMKLDPSFGEARWVVARSNDFGNTFDIDTKASGWSSPTSDVCDCCPGAIAGSGNKFAMMYRDNNSNIRDTWVGVSIDNANTFTSGFNADQQNWMIMNCPSSGPDGFILNDTLYSVFMNGNGGNRVYFNKTSMTSITSSGGINLTNSIPGLSQQNYPRIDRSGNAMAIVWKQIVSGTQMLSIIFSANLSVPLTTDYDTVALNNIVNTDVALFNGNICVIWEDDADGTVKYRMGVNSPLGAAEYDRINNLKVQVSPNHFSDQTTLFLSGNYSELSFEIFGVNGQLIRNTQKITSDRITIHRNDLDCGIYFVVVKSKEKIVDTIKMVVE